MNGLNKKELLVLLEIVSECVSCASLEAFCKIVKEMGYLVQSEKMVFLSSRFDLNYVPQAINEINISYPSDWTDVYRSQNFVKVDPITNIDKSGLYYWKDVYKVATPNSTFLSQAKSFDLSNGFTHIVKHNGFYGLMSIANSKLINSSRNKAIINYIAPHFHQLSAKLVHKTLYQRIPKITPREREVLLWTMEGKTNWEISVILNISQESVKDYVSSLLLKLNACNRTHAVAIALQNNLIFPF